MKHSQEEIVNALNTIKETCNRMKYTYYVAYKYESGDGGFFAKSNSRYNTQANLESLIDYISVNCCENKPVIITNLIELEAEYDEDEEN